MMPDSSDAAKENWGEKSVSDENKRTLEVEPKSQILAKKIKRRGGHICCIGGSPSPIFKGGWGRKRQFWAYNMF